jgi:hypothetical protein
MELALASMVRFCEYSDRLHPGNAMPYGLPDVLLIFLRGTDSFTRGCLVHLLDNRGRNESLRHPCGFRGGVDRWSPLCSRDNLLRLHSACSDTRDLLGL